MKMTALGHSRPTQSARKRSHDRNTLKADRATVRQKKTGRPVKFELTDQTRQAVADYLKAAGKNQANFYSRVDAALVSA
jgi:hypothetical protein